ncbi:28S ribosomal protein S18c, mitochondrial isoform X2 [Phoca vitulina]|uniref:28S ribosomal protein S18c, mitochondrial isoform X2 n=1 Tax=Phoca vitulina TaxID=9720 RepID=UPI0013961A40|nr:28S ribosomal protein S18c, mitochondrial isoform X2 [Phoca vitulina]
MGSQNKAHSLFHLKFCIQLQWIMDFKAISRLRISGDPVPMENPYKEPLKKCILCGKRVDYKNVQLLSQFISPFTGCIYGRHITGLCGKKQKEITKAIKRAQIMGFMPVTYKDPAYLKDPKVCNIKYRE